MYQPMQNTDSLEFANMGVFIHQKIENIKTQGFCFWKTSC